MSWKSIVSSAGLLCLLAAPVFAVPTLQVTNTGGVPGIAQGESSGHLNAAGEWVWVVAITPTGGSSVGAELGFTETTNNELLTATRNATNFDRENPGTVIFGWETLTDQGGGNMRPQGLQTNPATDEIFSSLGGPIFADATQRQYITITVQGPSVAEPSLSIPDRRTSTISWEGVFGSGDDGRITETFGTSSVKTDTFNGSASYTVAIGDANFDNEINGFDFNAWLFSTGLGWNQGDFVDDDELNGFDFNAWLFSPGPIGSGGGGVATPEPATAALVLLGGLLLTAIRGRRS